MVRNIIVLLLVTISLCAKTNRNFEVSLGASYGLGFSYGNVWGNYSESLELNALCASKFWDFHKLYYGYSVGVTGRGYVHMIKLGYGLEFTIWDVVSLEPYLKINGGVCVFYAIDYWVMDGVVGGRINALLSPTLKLFLDVGGRVRIYNMAFSDGACPLSIGVTFCF